MPYQAEYAGQTAETVSKEGLGTREKMLPMGPLESVGYPKCVEVVTAGTLQYLPLKNEDGDYIEIPLAAVAYRTPVAVREIGPNTSATVKGIYD